MRRGRRGVQGNGRGQASHLIGCGPELLRWRRDCSVDEWHREVEERYHRKQLPRDAEAGDVLFDDEDHVAENEQKGQGEHDCAIHASRVSIRLHLGPIGAVADVGAVARVEACAASRVQVARIDGCRVVEGSAHCDHVRCHYGTPPWSQRRTPRVAQCLGKSNGGSARERCYTGARRAQSR